VKRKLKDNYHLNRKVKSEQNWTIEWVNPPSLEKLSWYQDMFAVPDTVQMSKEYL
jgi:hypothetical protein